MTKFLTASNTNSNNEAAALKSRMIFPSVMLQRTSFKSKPSYNKEHLTPGLEMWKESKVAELLLECTDI